jgi:hypothetical protein
MEGPFPPTTAPAVSSRREAVELGSGNLTVLDWERLKVVGDFEPGYLHLRRAEHAAA